MRLIVLLLVLLVGSYSLAQNTGLTGQVFQIENGVEAPVAYAKVLMLNPDSTVNKGTTTDFNGMFKIQVAIGTHLIALRSGGLKDVTMAIEVKEGLNTPLKMEMEAPIMEMQEMKVIAYRTKTGEEELNKEVQASAGMDSKETAEQITAKGSGNTEEALTKMAGINSTNSVIYVRGMGDRYNAAYLNGLPVPSPNPELRVIPMDIFPTSIIDVLEVGKMMAPNYYGDFAGGAINIRTKKVFRTPTLKVTLGTGINTSTTFKDFTTYNGGKTDFLGFDDGTRALPETVIAMSQQNATAVYKNGLYNSNEGKGTGFANNFNTRTMKANPSTSFQIEGGNYKKFTKLGTGVGFVAMLSNSTGFQIQEGASRFINAQNQLQYDFATKKETYTASTTGLASVLFDVSANTKISANYLFINNSEDQTFQTWGYHRDFGDEKEVYSRRFTYKENRIHNMQLVGSTDNLLKKRLNLNYGISYSITSSVEPDRRQISAQYTDRNDTEHYKLLALDANHTNRFFSNLDENEMASHFDADYTIFENRSNDTVTASMKLIVGGDFKIKDRSFNFRQFNYLAKGLAEDVGDNFNINNPDAYLNDESVLNGRLRIEESANPGNGYSAYQEVKGGNVGMRYMISRKIEVIPNVRIESGFQSVESRNQVQANIIDRNIINGVNFMPSLAAKYSFNANNLIRFGASRTITRPKFFEVAPFEYLAQIAGMAQIGNPNLVNGVNNNVDLRYEYYAPNSSDVVSIGVFGKLLESPIEQIMRPSAGGQIISFDNTDGGIVSGVELEYAKNLSFLAKKGNRETSYLKNFSLAGNVAYIYSQITIKDNSGFTTNPKRPLQGASPIMVNVSAKYDKVLRRANSELGKAPMKFMASLSYSYSGKSLFAVGTQSMGDQYQFQNHLLNAVVQLKINQKWAVGLKGINLTDNLFRVMQQDVVNVGGWQDANSYRTGRLFSFSASYSF
jgi:TonB-dependent receptor